MIFYVMMTFDLDQRSNAKRGDLDKALSENWIKLSTSTTWKGAIDAVNANQAIAFTEAALTNLVAGLRIPKSHFSAWIHVSTSSPDFFTV